MELDSISPATRAWCLKLISIKVMSGKFNVHTRRHCILCGHDGQGLRLKKQHSTGELEKRGTSASMRSTGSSASWMSTESSQSAMTVASQHTDSNASFVAEVWVPFNLFYPLPTAPARFSRLTITFYLLPTRLNRSKPFPFRLSFRPINCFQPIHPTVSDPFETD